MNVDALTDPLAELAFAQSPPVARGRLRATPEDFQVDEELGFEPSGAGEHWLVRVRKRGITTEQAAKQLARLTGARVRDVGFAGMKDRRALTTQWFSVPVGKQSTPDWSQAGDDALQILSAARHNRKLRRRAHRANRFCLVVRDLDGAQPDAEQRLHQLAGCGFANYFGPQRFGRDGANVARARALLQGNHRVARAQRGMLYSALRSWLFNQLLSTRITDGSWLEPRLGDCMMLAGTRSFFVLDEVDLADAKSRHERADLDITGPLWGRARADLAGVQASEQRLLAPWQADMEGLEHAGIDAGRRALRARAHDLSWEWRADTELVLRFALEPGVYATSLVRELIINTGA